MSFLVLVVVDDEPDIEMLYVPARGATSKVRRKQGAAMEDIVEALKLCIVRGAQARNPGVPIRAEEIAAVSEALARP
jgi:hypothetical protein